MEPTSRRYPVDEPSQVDGTRNLNEEAISGFDVPGRLNSKLRDVPGYQHLRLKENDVSGSNIMHAMEERVGALAQKVASSASIDIRGM